MIDINGHFNYTVSPFLSEGTRVDIFLSIFVCITETGGLITVSTGCFLNRSCFDLLRISQKLITPMIHGNTGWVFSFSIKLKVSELHNHLFFSDFQAPASQFITF